MIRLAISVEGQTEEEFVRQVLARHLHSRDVFVTPVLLGRARYNVQGGGNVTINRLSRELQHLQYSFDAVTSLVDFYGFKDKNEMSPPMLVQAIENSIEQIEKRSIFPYVQVHEFEGLLFSDVNAFKSVWDNAPLVDLRKIRATFGTPEEINDSSETAPSKRISKLIPGYRKALHGPSLTREIGLDKLRNECPGFNAWLSRIEKLSENFNN